MKKITKILSVTSLILAGTGAVFAQCADISAPGVWDFVKTGTNPVVATTANPLSGTCSMAVPVQAGKRYVQDDMSAESTIRGSFQIDPNSLVMPTSGQQRKIKVHQVQCGAGCSSGSTVDWLQAKLRLQPGDVYKLGIWAREDNENKISTSVNLVDGCNTIEYQLISGNPGTFRLWVNNTNEGAPDFESTTANFSNRFADRVRLGRSGTGTNIVVGSEFYLDTFESRRQTFIGNSCTP